MPTNVAIRLQVEGGAQIKRELEEAGRAGTSAFQGVGTAADQATAATDRLKRKAEQAAEAARRVPPPGSGGATPTPAQQPTPSPAVQREVERLRSRLDEEYRNARALDRDTATIGRGEAAGSYSAEYAERLRGLAQSKYGRPGNDNAPGREGLSSYDKMFIRYQGFDVASSLGAGASPLTVAFQQGPQVLQQLADREGGLSTGLKQLGTSAMGLVTPLTVAGTAVTALGAVFALAASQAGKDQELLKRATKGIGSTTGASVTQLNAFATANAETGKVSTSTSREIVAAYTSAGNIALPVIGDLTRVTADYARLLGTDVPTATSELVRMFADPAAGADDLAKRIGGLDDRTRQLIQTQIEQGDRSGAQASLAESLRSTVEANTSATTGWAAAWDRAKAAADGYWEAAKRIAGIKLGIAPEGAQAAAARLGEEVENIDARRKAFGMDPLGLGSRQVAERDTARLIADTERRQAEARAAEERASQASRAAGDIARGIDPNGARLSQLRSQQSTLRDALADPLARDKLSDFEQTESAYNAVTRAIGSLTDANGKLISSEEMSRRQDQLRLDSLKATTTEEKAAVAERQKAFDLIGKTLTNSDARGQIERAGTLARIEAASKGGGSDTEKIDEFDRAVKSAEDRTRRAREQAETYGMSADAVERFRVQQELLTAAQRAGRDVTPDLTSKIEDYANQAAEAAKRNEDLRDSMRRQDQYRNIGSDSVRGLVRDLGDAKGATDILGNAFDRLKSRILDLASDNIADMLFGKRGSSSNSLLSGLFGGGTSASEGVGDTFSAIGKFFTGGSAIPAFDVGGYTGHGGRYDVAGFVHRGEVVFSQADVARNGGLGTVEMIRQGALRGYADGGPVGGYTMPRPALFRGTSQTGSAETVQGKTELHIYGGDENKVETSKGPQGPRHDIMIDKAVAAALMSGTSTRSVLKKLSGSSLRG